MAIEYSEPPPAVIHPDIARLPDLDDDCGPAPIPDEPARLAALHGLRVLDTVREEEFDGLTRWAVEHFGVPIALVSLVDAERQWFKSACNLDVPETPRDVAFCNYTILSSRPTVVEDAFADPRFCNNPLVLGEPHVRFYAGAPIIMPEGYAIGTFCLVDRKPRCFSTTDRYTLRQLAALSVERLLERRARMTG
ncbi:GAF domain-containing protein [Azospirillum halopraeferens]|uniref:GAF domain-containing protein n=1 Tax=Azospirillum halopraeferens TaxID=34010 RepID=UPI000424187D|nr:GAF domain-containing protein [Azospirillum halopraeferens]